MEQKGKSAVKEMLENNIFSISAYLKLLNGVLNSFEAKIIGEVSEVKISSAGHVYFSLKDKKDGSVLSCVIWNYDYRLSGIELVEGLEVKAKGFPDIYPVTGRLSFKAKTIQMAGEGALKKEYEKLKKKFEEEGLFDEQRKKEIPLFPRNIGVITSKQGAVINDFLNNLGRFGFKIQFIDSRVEGLEAVKDLISSVKTFKKKKIDVLVIMRGGGSLESFLAFNNEALIREIVDLSFPVIAAIGHDKDVPLLSLVADKMVSTPSMAANFLNQSWQKAEFDLKEIIMKITNSFSSLLSKTENKINNVFLQIKGKIEKVINDFKIIEYRITNVIPGILGREITKIKEKIINIEKIIKYNNPERNLKLGYCIAQSKKGIVKKIEDVLKDEKIDLKVYNGLINVKVNKIYERKQSPKKS
jgi:exodeoxyribonuclease VII large subunit